MLLKKTKDIEDKTTDTASFITNATLYAKKKMRLKTKFLILLT